MIVDYDINDYKEKTELTSKKLFTTLVTALRNYNSLESLQRGKDGLELVIDASAELFKIHSLQKFTSGILTQIMPILNFNHDSMYLQVNGFTAQNSDGEYKVLAGTGQYDVLSKHPNPTIDSYIMQKLNKAITQERSIFEENYFIGYVCLESGTKHLIYIKSDRKIIDKDIELLNLFLKNISIAFENIYFDQGLLDTQDELLELCTNFNHKLKQQINTRE